MHGFLTLSKEALIIYKTSDYYDPNNEFTLCWNDKELNIKSQRLTFIISEKDKKCIS